MKQNFVQYITSSHLNTFKAVFLVLFLIISKISLWAYLLDIPCDGNWLCGIFNHLDEIPWFFCLFLEFFGTAPFALVLFSWYGLFKKSQYENPSVKI